MAYDAAGNVILMTDGLGNSSRYEYTLTGRLKKVTDALGNETEYSYDACDRLIEVRQYGESGSREENGQDKSKSGTAPVPSIDRDLLEAQEHNRENRACRATRYERDLLGRVTKVTDALGNTESYGYDAKGQLIEKLDKDGYLTKYGYTAQGDVNRIAYADGREVKLSYNPLRQLKEMEDWLGITRIENDALGRAVKVQYPDGKEVSYSYGKAGERTGLTYPDGRNVTYTYDEAGRLSSLNDGNGTITYGYDKAGRLARKTFPGGMETSYAYDMAGHLSELIHSDREGILDAYAYRYDVLGNKAAIEKQRRGLPEESGVYTYGYDALGRLSSVIKDGTLLRSYAYDAFGNRTGLKEGEKETSYTYNALNQLIVKADEISEEIYTYDRRGNLSLVMENGVLKNQYTYGAINRFEQAVNGRGDVVMYTYNGLGHRIGKEINHGKEGYLLDFTRSYHNMLMMTDIEKSRIFYWDGNVSAMSESRTCEMPPIFHYYLQDGFGSPLRVSNYKTDASGKEDGYLTYGYDEFGNNLYDSLYNDMEDAGIPNPYSRQGEEQPFGYTGYRYDNISGTYFAQAREYQPQNGRFTAEDVIKGRRAVPETLNRYGYCWGNPLKWVDTNGEEPEDYAYIYYVNNPSAAGLQGHTAFLIVKENGMAEYYSYSTIQGDYLGKIFDSKTDDKEYEGRLYTNVPDGVQEDVPIDVFVRDGHVDEHWYANGSWKGRGKEESSDKFTRGIIIPISDKQGEKIHDAAQKLLYNPGVYNLWSNNCMHVAKELIRAGGNDLVLSEDINWLEEYPLVGSEMYSSMAFGSGVIPNQEYLLAAMTAGYYGYEDIIIGEDGECIND